MERLEGRRLLTVTIDDGAAGYSEGLATGAPLINSAAVDESSPDSVADGNGNLHAVYLSGGIVNYLYKPKGAGAWQSPVDLGFAATDPRIVADTLGNLHVVYSSGNEIFLRTRPAGSSTWAVRFR